MADTDRIDLVTGVRYTSRHVTENGSVTYMAWTGSETLGTVFKIGGMWSSVHPEDGDHKALRALSRNMMVRESAAALDRAIREWVNGPGAWVVTSNGVTADMAVSAMHSMIMALAPRTAS